jgi:hypothetical protein
MKVRAEILTRCIQTMMYLEELHNFNGIMEFIAALQNAGVFRLKETWARLDKKHKRAWDMLTTRLSRDNNFKVFRESLRTVSPPSIPYLGLFLTDMTFVEEVRFSFSEVFFFFDFKLGKSGLFGCRRKLFNCRQIVYGGRSNHQRRQASAVRILKELILFFVQCLFKRYAQIIRDIQVTKQKKCNFFG